MRVTGGVLGGRRLIVPRGDKVRPTQDRVREALFSALAPALSGARFLDLFAGAGSVGLEAWSRGAAYVCWVEADPRVHASLERNVAELCGSPSGGTPEAGWRVVKADVYRYIEHSRGGPPYDMVFADPPYDREARHRWADRLLAAVAEAGLLAVGGVLVIEQAAEEDEAVHEAWIRTGGRTYGGTRLSLYAGRNQGGS